MIIPTGDYRYEVRRSGEPVATERMKVGKDAIVGVWSGADGRSLEIDAKLDAEGAVQRLSARYSSTLFKRTAVYEAAEDNFRGSVSAVAGRNEIVIKLGRFREVDITGITMFRALIVARVCAREQPRWTGRVAVIDANTLVAASIKQTCRRSDQAGRRWTYETRMGDADEVELDDAGRLIRRRDNRGVEAVLAEFQPEPAAQ
jgi:hypothetical protein